MYISPVSFGAGMVRTQNIAASQVKKSVPAREKLLNDINLYWNELKTDPINEFSYENLKRTEKLLAANYPSDFMRYKRAYKLF